jgi:hypothetical protein
MAISKVPRSKPCACSSSHDLPTWAGMECRRVLLAPHRVASSSAARVDGVGEGRWFCAVIFSLSDSPTLGAAHVLSQETCPFVSCHSRAPSFFVGRDQKFRNARHGHLVQRCKTRELLVSFVWNFQQFSCVALLANCIASTCRRGYRIGLQCHYRAAAARPGGTDIRDFAATLGAAHCPTF